MKKKTLIACSAVAIVSGLISLASFADDIDASKAAPIHWGKAPIHADAGEYKNGKTFCSKKYIGRKTCIPGMNNTSSNLTFEATTYDSDVAPASSVVSLMGTDKLDTVVFTVKNIDADGKVNTVYSGPANNREGVICNEDQATKAIACNAWK